VSAHNDFRGIYKITFNHDNGGFAEKVVSNGGSLCNKVHSLTTYCAMPTSLHWRLGVEVNLYFPAKQQVSALNMALDTSTGTLQTISSATSLKHLHLFGLHTKTSTSVIVEIPQAIEGLEKVYSFDKRCVN